MGGQGDLLEHTEKLTSSWSWDVRRRLGWKFTTSCSTKFSKFSLQEHTMYSSLTYVHSLERIGKNQEVNTWCKVPATRAHRTFFFEFFFFENIVHNKVKKVICSKKICNLWQILSPIGGGQLNIELLICPGSSPRPPLPYIESELLRMRFEFILKPDFLTILYTIIKVFFGCMW